jgi:hypothetical protein
MPALVAAMGFTSLAEFESFVTNLHEAGILAEVLPELVQQAAE